MQANLSALVVLSSQLYGSYEGNGEGGIRTLGWDQAWEPCRCIFFPLVDSLTRYVQPKSSPLKRPSLADRERLDSKPKVSGQSGKPR
jgi:hypothetical protein